MHLVIQFYALAQIIAFICAEIAAAIFIYNRYSYQIGILASLARIKERKTGAIFYGIRYIIYSLCLFVICTYFFAEIIF